MFEGSMVTENDATDGAAACLRVTDEADLPEEFQSAAADHRGAEQVAERIATLAKQSNFPHLHAALENARRESNQIRMIQGVYSIVEQETRELRYARAFLGRILHPVRERLGGAKFKQYMGMCGVNMWTAYRAVNDARRELNLPRLRESRRRPKAEPVVAHLPRCDGGSNGAVSSGAAYGHEAPSRTVSRSRRTVGFSRPVAGAQDRSTEVAVSQRPQPSGSAQIQLELSDMYEAARSIRAAVDCLLEARTPEAMDILDRMRRVGESFASRPATSSASNGATVDVIADVTTVAASAQG